MSGAPDATATGAETLVPAAMTTSVAAPASRHWPGPLAGRRILLVRAEDPGRGPDQLALALEQAGADCQAIASTRFAPPVDGAALARARDDLRQGGAWTWAVFTSPRAAAALDPGDARPWPRVACAAVGPATAAALRAAGQEVALCQEEGGAEALGQRLAARLRPGDRVLLPAGDLAGEALAERLAATGAHVQVLVAYRTLPRSLNAVEEAGLRGAADALVFSSGSGAAALLPFLRERVAAGWPVLFVALGPRTAADLRGLGLPVGAVAAAPSGAALVTALVRAFERSVASIDGASPHL